MNGNMSLGLPPEPLARLIQRLEKGLSFGAMQKLAIKSGLPVTVIAEIIGVPERTFARRRASGILTTDESERLLRLSRVFEQAVDLFEGDAAAAVGWLSSPKKALGQCRPIELARFEAGAREVENLIGRIEHGVFS